VEVGAERAETRNSGCRRSIALVGLALLVALVALVGMIRTASPASAKPVAEDVTAAATNAAPKPVTVRILPTGIDPAMVEIAPGATVVWVNRAGASRSILATDASFDSGALADGERFQFAFTEPRTVSYSVVQSPGISGTIVVRDPSAPAPVATPVPGAAPAATPPGFAYTGSSTAVNAAIGGLVLALGATLLYAAQRFGVVAAISRLTFSVPADDLLPSRRHRRIRKAESRRGRIGR
jgi:plastocyanin